MSILLGDGMRWRRMESCLRPRTVQGYVFAAPLACKRSVRRAAGSDCVEEYGRGTTGSFVWLGRVLVLFALQLLPASLTHGAGVIETPSITGTVPVRSWKELHDEGIVRQQHDFSCGAAALATVMGLYGRPVNEATVMQAMGKEHGQASLEDMAEVLPRFGFKALGVAVSFEQLTTLKQPVVAYLHQGRRDHFTVIRGVSPTHVWLGDPSWGNLVVTREHFLRLWETRDDAVLKGTVLVIQPQDTLPLRPGAFGPPVPSRVLGRHVLMRPF